MRFDLLAGQVSAVLDLVGPALVASSPICGPSRMRKSARSPPLPPATEITPRTPAETTVPFAQRQTLSQQQHHHQQQHQTLSQQQQQQQHHHQQQQQQQQQERPLPPSAVSLAWLRAAAAALGLMHPHHCVPHRSLIVCVAWQCERAVATMPAAREAADLSTAAAAAVPVGVVPGAVSLPGTAAADRSSKTAAETGDAANRASKTAAQAGDGADGASKTAAETGDAANRASKTASQAGDGADGASNTAAETGDGATAAVAPPPPPLTATTATHSPPRPPTHATDFADPQRSVLLREAARLWMGTAAVCEVCAELAAEAAAVRAAECGATDGFPACSPVAAEAAAVRAAECGGTDGFSARSPVAAEAAAVRAAEFGGTDGFPACSPTAAGPSHTTTARLLQAVLVPRLRACLASSVYEVRAGCKALAQAWLLPLLEEG